MPSAAPPIQKPGKEVLQRVPNHCDSSPLLPTWRPEDALQRVPARLNSSACHTTWVSADAPQCVPNPLNKNARHTPWRSADAPQCVLKAFVNEKALFVIMAVLTTVLYSCKTTERATNEMAVKNRTAGYVLKRYNEARFDYGWLGMKVDADFGTETESSGFKATIRMRKDSLIWVSITPALGIEMIRVVVSPDSLKYLSKIPDNKFYYVGAFEDVNRLVGTSFDFEMLQQLLVGNAIGLEKDERRFRSEVDSTDYLLISKYRRKVRRVVGVDDRKLESDTIVVNPNDPRFKRTVRKNEDADDLIISRYWFEALQFRLVKSVFNDLIRQRTLEISYDSFQQNDKQFYPSKCRLTISSPQVKQVLNYEITKLSSGKAYDFPFEIPEDYPRRDSL